MIDPIEQHIQAYRQDPIEGHLRLELARLRAENCLLKEYIEAGRKEPTCVVCGRPIENISTQRMARPFLWHNRECFQLKPGKIIALEHKYQLDIVDILRETTRRYGNIKAQCNALGVSIPYFYAIIRKYGDSNMNRFLAAYSTGKRRDLYMKKIKKYKSMHF